MTYRNKALTRSARVKPCLGRFPKVCVGGTDTTVWAHSNLAIPGHGLGEKAHDCFGAYLCYGCHAWLDAGSADRSTRQEWMRRAMDRTWLFLFETGVVSVVCPD